ncbi:MAG: hypothetical protein JNL83_38860 [Myxococcales bacterium]|nr:hypothetical protein [Myxococcales bacterium]
MRRAALFTLALAACAQEASGPDVSGPSFPEQHPRIYLPAHRERLVAALEARTPEAQRFREIADRWVAGDDVYAFPAWQAALLGQLTGEPAYCTAAVAAIHAQVTDAAKAIARGDAPAVASDSYLEVGELVGDLALVFDWCYGAVGDKADAWLQYANQAVHNVWNPETASWAGRAMPWTGWAIDDPSDNYYYSFLRATMLVGLATHGERPGMDAWLDVFQDKLDRQLFPTFDAELSGGGSREGTGYGVAMRGLFELYDLWHASTGEPLASRTPHTRASMLAFIHATVPTLDRIAPIGDHSRDSTAALFDYHRNYAQELIALFPDDPLAPRLAALLASSSVPRMSQQFMAVYDFLHATDVAPTTLDGLGTAFYAPGTGELFARSGWDQHATWLSLIAGPYTQSHAHQDQGSLMLYKDGWLAYDAVIDSRSGLRQEVGAHGTLRITSAGGEELAQETGTAARVVALHRGAGYLHVAADLAPVYGGAVPKLEREVVYLEPNLVVVFDRARTPVGGEQIWSLATPVSPTLAAARSEIRGGGHVLTVERVSPEASASVHSFASGDDDFLGGFRLDETAAGGDRRWLHVLSIDNAAAVTKIDATTVELSMGGQTVRVHFEPDSVGATLVRGGQTTRLGAGVDDLPE